MPASVFEIAFAIPLQGLPFTIRDVAERRQSFRLALEADQPQGPASVVEIAFAIPLQGLPFTIRDVAERRESFRRHYTRTTR